MSEKKARLEFDGKTIELDSLTGTENETGLDITKLRAETGLITLDPAYGNTGSCTSDITFIDGGKGILRYRGYAIEELCEKSDFLESAFWFYTDTFQPQRKKPLFKQASIVLLVCLMTSWVISMHFPKMRLQWQPSRR